VVWDGDFEDGYAHGFFSLELDGLELGLYGECTFYAFHAQCSSFSTFATIPA